MRWAFVVVVAAGLGIAAYLYARPGLTSEQQSSLNFLDSSLFDLEHPTAANANVRTLECTDAATKADGYRKLPGLTISRKVARFLELCARDAADPR